MTCECIKQMDAKLAEHNTKLGVTFGFGRDGSCYTLPHIHTEKVEKRVRKGPALAIPTFCPFCGERYAMVDTREPCRMCSGKGGVNEGRGDGCYVGAKCPACHGFGTEEVLDLIVQALSESMGPDWTPALGAAWVADALSNAGMALPGSAPHPTAEATTEGDGQ